MKTLTIRTSFITAALLTGCTLSNTSEGGADGLNLEARSDRPTDRSIEVYLNPGENPLAALTEIETEDADVLANSNVVVGVMMNELGAYYSAANLYTPGGAAYETQTEQCEGRTLADAVDVICENITPPEDDPDTEENESENGVQLLFIDENPIFAQHRVTGRRLLECARAAGFEYFVIEALAEPASALIQRGYVSKTASGPTLREPQLAGLVEDAMALGFTPVSLPPDTFCGECTQAQAFSRNAEPKADSLIEQTLMINPDAKVLVWTGPGQSFEQKWGPRPFIDSLASFVFQKSTIDPYTFIQRTLDPRSALGEPPASGIYLATGPDNGSCSGSYSPGSATGLSTHDGVIIHVAPAAGSDGGDAARWEWLHTPPENRMSVTAECASCAAGERLLVQAFPPGVDIADRVPADQALCEAGAACEMALPAGAYQLVVWSDTERLTSTEVTLSAGAPTTVTMN